MGPFETRRRFWRIATAGIFFRGGAAAVDTGTFVAALVHGLMGSPAAVGAIAAASGEGEGEGESAFVPLAGLSRPSSVTAIHR